MIAPVLGDDRVVGDERDFPGGFRCLPRPKGVEIRERSYKPGNDKERSEREIKQASHLVSA